MKRDRRTFPRLAYWEWIVVGGAIANFIGFMVVSLWLGGTAANGMIDGNRYYLGEHGHFTEVSRSVFSYSQTHLRLMIATQIIALGVLIVAKLREMVAGDPEE